MKAQSHIGITVKNLDESLYFYHDLLGLEIATEPSPWFDHPGLGPAVGVPGAILRQVCLKLGDTLMELLEYSAPPSDTSAPLRSNSLGASHVAFLVDDIEETVKDLSSKGIEFFSPVNVVDEGVLSGWRWVYFSDPDGYPLELVQIAYERPGGHEAGITSYLQNRRLPGRQFQ